MKRSRRILLITAIALVAVLGVAGIAYAITNGVPDGDRHPYVGLLVFDSAPEHPAGAAAAL